jgi:hypothetical protein
MDDIDSEMLEALIAMLNSMPWLTHRGLRHVDPRRSSDRECREQPEFHRARGTLAGRFPFSRPRSVTL